MSDYWHEQRYLAMHFAIHGRDPEPAMPAAHPCSVCAYEDDGIAQGLYAAGQMAARNRQERVNARKERREPEIVGHEACRRCPDCGCSRTAEP